jgi:MFS family permease
MTLDTPRAKNLALLLLAMTQFVLVIDASIVNVALPSIGRALSFSQADLSWVVNAYTLTFGGFLLLGGRLADLMGRRRMFMVGLVLFSLASLLGGLAQSEGWLIAARAVQGLGGAIVSPAALSIITTTFADGEERNRALGVWGPWPAPEGQPASSSAASSPAGSAGAGCCSSTCPSASPAPSWPRGSSAKAMPRRRRGASTFPAR